MGSGLLRPRLPSLSERELDARNDDRRGALRGAAGRRDSGADRCGLLLVVTGRSVPELHARSRSGRSGRPGWWCAGVPARTAVQLHMDTECSAVLAAGGRGGGQVDSTTPRSGRAQARTDELRFNDRSHWRRARWGSGCRDRRNATPRCRRRVSRRA